MARLKSKKKNYRKLVRMPTQIYQIWLKNGLKAKLKLKRLRIKRKRKQLVVQRNQKRQQVQKSQTNQHAENLVEKGGAAEKKQKRNKQS